MISITIIAKDASATLGKCLESVDGLSDDVVVVIDDRTVDKTKDIARKSGARVFNRKFADFASQKNFALSKTKHDCVLSLDADEEITPDLFQEIKKLDFRHDAYILFRKNIIFGKIINHTNWDPNGSLRLFKKSQAHFSGQVHEQVFTFGSVGKLKNPFTHYNYSSVEEFISRMNIYTSMETKVTNPLYDFGRRFVWHAGYLDGWHGLFLSYLMAIYHLCVWVKSCQKIRLSS